MMKEFRNSEFVVVFENEKEFTVTNKFGDEYKCRLEDGVVVSYSRLGLAYAMKARKQFNF